MSTKTNVTVASAFGTIATTLGKKAPIVKTQQPTKTTKVSGAAAIATPTDQRKVNREMRKFARGLKAMGVRRLRFMPYAKIPCGAAFRATGKVEDRVAELTHLYKAEGAFKSVKSADDATIIRLSYSRTSRVEVMNKSVVFYA